MHHARSAGIFWLCSLVNYTGNKPLVEHRTCEIAEQLVCEAECPTERCIDVETLKLQIIMFTSRHWKVKILLRVSAYLSNLCCLSSVTKDTPGDPMLHLMSRHASLQTRVPSYAVHRCRSVEVTRASAQPSALEAEDLTSRVQIPQVV